MSADNWAVCPICADDVLAARATEAARREEELAAAYGTVSPQEYLAMASAPKADHAPLDPDFREDWEIGLVGHPETNREVFISYKGACMKCGAGVTFTTTLQVTP